MGLYDEIIVKCFRCGEAIEFQSKAGNCDMSTYTLEDLPNEIAVDLDGETQNCEKCGYRVKLSLISKPVLIAIPKAEDFDLIHQ